VGVIGTAGTIASGAYEHAIHDLAPTLDVRAVSCPLFVPLVEEGWTAHAATRLVVREYLAPLRAAHIDTLVLGCTHYPLLAGALRDEMGAEVVLIDSAAETAAETTRVLQAHSLRNPLSERPRYRIVVSDAPERFLPLGRAFLDAAITHVEHVAFA
jgi:glutamate racemase